MHIRKSCASVIAITAALLGVQAHAQTGASGGGAASATVKGAAGPDSQDSSSVAEVVVTGLKRSEKFINAPVAVQVFSEKTLAQAGISRPQDFLAQTPNVTFIQSNHAGEAFVNIRGQTSVRQSESAVAVVIDGVQLATQNEFNGELFDVQQIEVLKGPQSALYGRNATAGAIIITTKPPTDDFQTSLSASYGNFQTGKLVASTGGPIIPGKLRFRAAFVVNDTDGPYRNDITGERPYRVDEKDGRLRFDYEATDKLKFDLRLNASHLEGGAIAANAQGPGIKNGGVPSPVDNNVANQPFVSDVQGFDRQNKFNTSLKADYDLGFGTFTSVSAYNKITDLYQAKLFPYQDASDSRNDAGSAILFGDQTQKYQITNESFNEEIRLTSKGGGRLRYQAGLFFLRLERNFITLQGFNGRVPLNADGSPNAGIGGFVPDPNGAIFASLDPAVSTFLFGAPIDRFTRVLVGGGTISPSLGISGLGTTNPTNAYDVSQFNATNLAPFANAQFDITSQLELGVALRYDMEHRSVRTQTPDTLNPFTGGSFNQCVAILGVDPSECHRSKTFYELQPKVNLTYKVPSLGSVYATFGRGFKSGGFNPIGTRETVVRATAVGTTRAQAEALTFVQDSYDKEVSDSYEVGFKSQFLQKRLSLNGAVFHTDVSNAQQFIFFPAGSVQAVVGIDQVKIDGFEFDTNYRLTDELTVFGGYGTADPRVKEYRAQPADVGNRAPYVSRYNITAGVQINHPLIDGLDLNARGEFNRQGSIYFDAANTPGTQRGPINLLDGRIGIGNDRWEIDAFGRNLLDEQYRVESVVLVTGLGVFNPGFKGPGRTFGLEAKLHF